MNLARIIVRRKGQVIRRCKNCGSDLAYGWNQCCQEKRRLAGRKSKVK